ncbi:uncharacterized protein zgc:193811 [Hypomesus transpacificus]|uniref:uncharacterized protein zgc:193811 n=1 Tax=Hypomesus transpacificus TaxID=137520 RepID=UPI001F0788FD|nr:uncharacterized protein zgc:193811 [Hypomesus transpacificus]
MELHKDRLTSSGIGHIYTQPPPFFVESRKGLPLPPVLQGLPLVSDAKRFSVTSRTDYDSKPLTGPLATTRYPRAPPHWNIHYINELAQKLRNCESVRLLSRPVSEMQDSFKGLAAQEGPQLDNYNTLRTIHGQLNHVPSLRIPFVSTSHEDYRPYSRSEITPPSLDALPSRLGLLKSSAHSHLPPHKASPRVSCGPRLPPPVVTLPYAGKCSVYRSSFTVPAPQPGPTGPQSEAMAGCESAAVQARDGAGGGQRGLLRSILEVPKMYLAESQTYGGKKRVLV